MTDTNKNIEESILTCVAEFKGGIGLKRLSKVLFGKPSLGETSKNAKGYGALKEYSLVEINSFIIKLINSNLLTTRRFRGNIVVQVNKLSENISDKISKLGEVKDTKNIVIPTESDDENVSKALKLLSEKKNVFITGHAGTGKSYILEKLKEIIPDIVITSTTGIAAVNVNGQTLHSWAGIGICTLPVETTVSKILADDTALKRIRDCCILAIDEVSMLDIKTFEYTDSVLRAVRGTDKPFGGIQTILLGDFYQLPPVEEKNSELKKGYCFESELWDELEFSTIILTKNYRQNEENLIKALSDIRNNNLTIEDEKLLRTRECKDSDELADILHIFATNEEAKDYNDCNFALIDSEEKTYNAIDIHKGRFDIDKYCRVGKEITLKVGARVMLLINKDFDKCLINGSCGNVIETGSTKKDIRVEICSKCHPFFTGKQKLVDTGGRVDRFKKRFGMDK